MDNAAEIEAIARRLQADGAEFYLVSNDALKPQLDLSPLGIDLTWIDALDSAETPWSVMEFLKLYNLIDGLAFGGRGLAMPHWVMVDLALLPSAIVIAAWSKDRLLEEIKKDQYSHDAREGLNAVLADAEMLGYDGPIPVAAYCAAPSAQPLRWVGWSLWSFVVGHGLATAVKGLALRAYRATVNDGVTQYDNVSLRIHTKFGPLHLRSALFSIHTAANSFVYETDLVSPPMLPAEPTFWLDARDLEKQTLMQKAIETKSSDFYVIAPGISYNDGLPIVPIVEIAR